MRKTGGLGWTIDASSASVRYGWAAVFAAAAVGVTNAIAPLLHVPSFHVCVGAVAVSAAFGGTGPGLLTAAVAGVLVAVSSPRLAAPEEVVLLGAFALVSAVVAYAAGWSRHARVSLIERRHHTARTIRARLEFLRAITRAMDDGVYALDGTGRITYLNAAAERLLGYRQGEVLGRTMKEALRCKRIDGTCSGDRCRLLHVVATGEPVRGADDLLTRKDGTCFPVRYSSAPLTRGGRPVGAVVVFQDVTEERRHEDRDRFLARATQELSSSIDFEETLARVARLALPFLGDWCMVVLAEEGATPRRVAVESRNPARAAIAREMLEHYPIDLEADHGAGRVLRTGEPELLVDASALGSPHGGRSAAERRELLRRLGLTSFMAVPLRVRGRVIGVLDFGITDGARRYGAADLAVALDLAARSALALDNARLYQQAQAAIRAREQTLAVVSHDLRNPVGAIRMAASVVGRASSGSSDRVRNAATTIERGCDRMARLIGDLTDVASIDSGRLSVEHQRVSARVVVEEAVDAVREAAREARVQLTSDRSGEHLDVRGDSHRLVQVLVNLLSNAVRITPPGGRVWVRQRRRGDALVLSVSDTGPGIAREQQARIFDAYWRGADVGYKGTGLGLAIANGIVQAHGGRLWVVSKPGRGATFRFTVPLAPAATSAVRAVRATSRA